jgi:peptidoglycan/LPS O-acetylase OafA/YrhL
MAVQDTPGAVAPRVRPAGGGERRADIEGLRAIAVVLVLLFHASIGGFTGGFVGVDVFFVISGFLITGLLLREREATGTISLTSFYARRVRRLLPAAALVLLVALAASVLFLPPLLLPGIAGDTTAAALYVSNMGFAAQATDYFAQGQAPSPILHFWSLGVEEQFYLFWPAIVLLVARGAMRPTRRVGAAIVVIALVSFTFALWLTSVAEPWAFFSLPSRAWELGLGGILAVAGARLRRVPVPLAVVAGWLGIGLIVAAGLVLSDSTAFPGTAALLPTIGAALVIVAGSRSTRFGPARLLGTSVPRFFGRISYSLYLWHWPLLVIPAVALGAALPLWQRGSLVVVAIALAAATHRWVEDPLRRGRLVGTIPRRNLAMAGALTLAVAVASMSVDTSAASIAGESTATVPQSAATNQQRLDAVLNALASEQPDASAQGGAPSVTGGSPPVSSGDGGTGGSPAPGAVTPSPAPTAKPAPTRPPTADGAVPRDLQPSVWNARNDYPQSYLDGCHTQTEQPASTEACLYGNLSSKVTIALFGDSHALSWFPAVDRMVVDRGWRLLSLTMSACSPATMPVYNPNFGRVSTACPTWRSQALDRIVAAHPDIVLVTGTRGFANADASGTVLSGDLRTHFWEQGIKRTLDRLKGAAGEVIYIADTPVSRVDPPACLSQHPSSVLACATAVSQALDPAWTAEERRMAALEDVGFIDPSMWVCPSGPCPVVLGDLLVYRDGGHLTATFSAALGGRMESAVLADVNRRRPGLLH